MSKIKTIFSNITSLKIFQNVPTIIILPFTLLYFQTSTDSLIKKNPKLKASIWFQDAHLDTFQISLCANFANCYNSSSVPSLTRSTYHLQSDSFNTQWNNFPKLWKEFHLTSFTMLETEPLAAQAITLPLSYFSSSLSSFKLSTLGAHISIFSSLKDQLTVCYRTTFQESIT